MLLLLPPPPPCSKRFYLAKKRPYLAKNFLQDKVVAVPIVVSAHVLLVICQQLVRRSMHWEGEALSAVEVPVTGRDAFFTSLTNCVLSCYRQHHALKALFCSPELHNEPPPHIVAYSTFELLCFIVKCQFHPRLLELSCNSIIGLWDRKEESFSLLSALSSEATHLAIYEYAQHNLHVQAEVLSKICRYLLEAVFSNPRPSVTHFKLTCSDQVFSLRALGHVACIMGSKSSQCGQFTREVHTQYSGLRLLTVCMENWPTKHLPALCKQNVDIQSIIENQKNLHTLHIRTRPTRMGSVATPEYDQLIRCVGNLFSKHTFHRLGLYDFSFSHSSGQHVRCFNEIMLNFLCSPVRGQELELNIPSDLTLGDLHMHQCQQPPDTVKNSKSLLIKQYWTPPHVNTVFDAFFSAFFSSSFYPLWTLGYLYLDCHLNLPADTLATISELEWPAS